MPKSDKKNLGDCVSETANRLRLIQVDFANDSEQTRMDYLSEEIKRILKTVVPEQRKVFLEKLMERFPTGHLGTTVKDEQPQSKSQTEIEVEELNDPELAVRRLLELAPMLSDEQKGQAAGRLQEAGFGQPVVARSYSDEFIRDLRAALQLGDVQDIQTDRLAEMIVLLADFVFKLEPLIWNTWRMLSPRSGIRPSGSLKKTMGQFICGDSATPEKKAENELKMLQRLIAAITTAVGRVGSQFAKRHLGRFSPSEISTLVRMEHGSVFVSHEVKCWRKYLELAETLTEGSIEAEIRKAIADYAESLIKGPDR
ncbi:MAG: hypothetical protein AMJ70_01895 [Dehalococcoidia bacterium SG8_51_3]|nr:MAG: hypothetical protein AMJ70_01895 [Dehalococcoidia bacterium SG8_51_3]